MEEKRCRTCEFDSNSNCCSPMCETCGPDKKNWKAAVKWEIPKLNFNFDYSAISKATKLIDPSEIVKKHITVEPWVINDKDESSLYPNLIETFEYFVNDVKNTEEMMKRMSAKKKINEYRNKPEIERVIFNYPATIVLWTDGTKTIVKAQGDEVYDKEKGLAMAICKKLYGNTGRYFEEFKKWIPEEKKIESGQLEKKIEESPNKKPAKNNNTKVLCVETDLVYYSIGSAAKSVGCSAANISSVLHGKRKTAGGYHWRIYNGD